MIKKALLVLALVILIVTSVYAGRCGRSPVIASLGSTADLVEELYDIVECLEDRIDSLESRVRYLE